MLTATAHKHTTVTKLKDTLDSDRNLPVVGRLGPGSAAADYKAHCAVVAILLTVTGISAQAKTPGPEPPKVEAKGSKQTEPRIPFGTRGS